MEAKYPALLFKQQLDAFVQKIFPMMRDNVKKLITPMLANCIHTPKGVARARGQAGADQQVGGRCVCVCVCACVTCGGPPPLPPPCAL